MGYPLRIAQSSSSFQLLSQHVMKYHFLKQTNTKLRVSVHSYIHYNVFQMDLQGSTLVGKHLFVHMDL